jgi:uncharacterized protein YndB with AHSA1/START domain
MPAVEMHFDTTPERTFEVLSQPRHYGFWVTGSREIEDHDPRWPQPGSAFRHTQGVWPLLISDTTSVVACDAPRRLELEARVRPLLVARIILELFPQNGGTRVRMEEVPAGGVLELPLKLPPWPLLLQARNKESLRRLRRLAEG